MFIKISKSGIYENVTIICNISFEKSNFCIIKNITKFPVHQTVKQPTSLITNILWINNILINIKNRKYNLKLKETLRCIYFMKSLWLREKLTVCIFHSF